MKSFKQFLDEARRNPELNPKISIYNALEPYKDQDDMYITFTEDVGKDFSKKSFNDKDKRPRGKEIPSLDRNISGFKVGINPKSTYNTPNGIYVYPLKQAWKLYADEQKQLLSVPFAGRSPMVSLLQKTPEANIVDVWEISSKDYKRDYMKLAKMIIKNVKSGSKLSEAFGWEYAKGVLELALKNSKDKSPGGIWWNMTRYTFFAILRFSQRSSSFFTSDVPAPRYKDEVMAMMKDPNMKADFGDMTNRFPNMSVSKNTTKSSNAWTKIFLDLGIDGVTDRTGSGIIHPAEPMQGVFFNPSAYKVVGSFYNKAYKHLYDPLTNTINNALTKLQKKPIQFSKTSLDGNMVGAKITQNEFFKGAISAAGAISKYFIFLKMLVNKFLEEIHGDKVFLISPTDDGFIDIQNAVLNKDSSSFDFEVIIRDKSNSELVKMDYDYIYFYGSNGKMYDISWDDLGDEYERDELKNWMDSLK